MSFLFLFASLSQIFITSFLYPCFQCLFYFFLHLYLISICICFFNLLYWYLFLIYFSSFHSSSQLTSFSRTPFLHNFTPSVSLYFYPFLPLFYLSLNQFLSFCVSKVAFLPFKFYSFFNVSNQLGREFWNEFVVIKVAA